jgi:hypothetical protein
MGDPPLSGANQFIVTWSKLNMDCGAIGVSGIWAAKIVTELEKALKP